VLCFAAVVGGVLCLQQEAVVILKKLFSHIFISSSSTCIYVDAHNSIVTVIQRECSSSTSIERDWQAAR